MDILVAIKNRQEDFEEELDITLQNKGTEEAKNAFTGPIIVLLFMGVMLIYFFIQFYS